MFILLMCIDNTNCCHPGCWSVAEADFHPPQHPASGASHATTLMQVTSQAIAWSTLSTVLLGDAFLVWGLEFNNCNRSCQNIYYI